MSALSSSGLNLNHMSIKLHITSASINKTIAPKQRAAYVKQRVVQLRVELLAHGIERLQALRTKSMRCSLEC